MPKRRSKLQIYTPQQLAKRWNCCTNTVRNAIISGELRAFRVGRLFRIPEESVINFERRFAAKD
ncbi:excisionase family DNA-binding protein [Celeribacter halophilus]|uniref:excisionase family DNA-binding protein n=1 Tax=Celeribacter halophilus TaxID=576117 RepID=UPI003A599619